MSSSNSSSNNDSKPAAVSGSTDTGDQNKGLQDAALAVSVVGGGILAFKALAAIAAASLTLSVSILPIMYFYGIQTRPPESSFDAKKELRAVLNGENLPDDHPNKPKAGTLKGLWKGAIATLQSELATYPGYEVTMTSVGGAAWIATITLPTADLRCTWIGCNRQWYYWGGSKLTPSSATTASAKQD